MRLGILCHNYPPHPGGLEVMVRTVATQLARRGHQVTVMTSQYDPSLLLEKPWMA